MAIPFNCTYTKVKMVNMTRGIAVGLDNKSKSSYKHRCVV